MTYKEACDFLDELWRDRGLNVCWGCHESHDYEHHHIISRQNCGKYGRKDLLTDPENIIPLCYTCHHNKWHDGGLDKILELKCLDIILDFYKKEIPELYWKLKYRIDDHLIARPE